MLYQVSRNGQIYGPYALEDLARYVESGNVQLTDMAKSEEMADWVPVSQILGVASTPSPGAPPYEPIGGSYPPPQYTAPIPGAWDAPPNLSWGLVLLFGFLTCTVFMYIWNLIMAAWVNRVVPESKVLILYIAGTVLMILQVFAGAKFNMALGGGYHTHPDFTQGFGGPYASITFVCWIVRLIARFAMRNTLERHFNTTDPVGLRLSGVMTFFFGGVYFQYHINRINDIKRAMSYRAGY
ncbi:DUF4339 domain-containing protein [Granulicella sibirica]|uniref:GYF domain-containing protein n=1 Tax=Granulicella sibirica TaxID=2479048 RepID=A0A4Q0SYE0_9BACT|nr:DUF4339 domain-containing protein [Granulicella sibirica]RXH54519.1 hypothetical protein GRAN_3622 [Granulicella sibirica]